jgi:hypothetical protein
MDSSRFVRAIMVLLRALVRVNRNRKETIMDPTTVGADLAKTVLELALADQRGT